MWWGVGAVLIIVVEIFFVKSGSAFGAFSSNPMGPDACMGTKEMSSEALMAVHLRNWSLLPSLYPPWEETAHGDP